MMNCSPFARSFPTFSNVAAFFFGSVLVLTACTNDEDIGSRDADGGATSAGNFAARVVAACEASPNHRLNWIVDRASGSDMKKVPAPAGRCAEITKCLDSGTLDPTVAAKAVDCLLRDTDKDVDPACTERDVANASATRTTVTAAQSACAKKREACARTGLCDHTDEYVTVVTDAVAKDYVACFDKPCGNVAECARALTRADAECIDALYDPYPYR